MGLHQYDTLTKSFSLETELAWAIRLFWSVYVLDRRWSFGMGMPFAIQDVDIDPALPQPVCTPQSCEMRLTSRRTSVRRT